MELASLAMLNETFNAIFKHCDAVLDFVGKNFIKIHLFFGHQTLEPMVGNKKGACIFR